MSNEFESCHPEYCGITCHCGPKGSTDWYVKGAKKKIKKEVKKNGAKTHSELVRR
jgi:hypothetical protein